MQRTVRGALSATFLLVVSMASAAKAQESWDAIYIKGEKIGHVHVWIEPIKQASTKNRDLVNVRVDWDMVFKRGKDRVHMKQHYGTIEKKNAPSLSGQATFSPELFAANAAEKKASKIGTSVWLA